MALKEFYSNSNEDFREADICLDTVIVTKNIKKMQKLRSLFYLLFI